MAKKRATRESLKTGKKGAEPEGSDTRITPGPGRKTAKSAKGAEGGGSKKGVKHAKKKK